MEDVGLIGAYLDAMGRALRVGPLRRRRIRAEIEAHLADDAAAERGAGATAEEAARRAIARLGPPAELAGRFAAELAPARARARLRMALGLATVGIVLARLAPSGNGPTPLLAAAVEAEAAAEAAPTHTFVAARAARARRPPRPAVSAAIAIAVAPPEPVAEAPVDSRRAAPTATPAPALLASLAFAAFAGDPVAPLPPTRPHAPLAPLGPAAPSGPAQGWRAPAPPPDPAYVLVHIDGKEFAWERSVGGGLSYAAVLGTIGPGPTDIRRLPRR